MLHGTFESPHYEADRPGASQLWVEAGSGDNAATGPIHAHPGVELGIVLGGREEIQFASLLQTCREGDVWMVSMWEPHGWRIPPPGCFHVVLVFAPEFLGDELAGELPWLSLFAVPPAQRPSVLSPERRASVIELGHIIFREIRRRRPYWRSAVRLEVLRLLVELRRGWDQGDVLPATAAGAHMHALQQVLPALSLLNTTPRRRVSMSEAASTCGLSPSRFDAPFRTVMGTSFSKLALRSRLSLAAQLLASTDRSVGAIAAECGFVHDSHLHRHFVRHFGCTPNQYRQSRRDAPLLPSSDAASIR